MSYRNPEWRYRNEFKSEVSLPSFQEWSKFKLHWASQILITSLSKLIHSASHFSADWWCHIVVRSEDTDKNESSERKLKVRNGKVEAGPEKSHRAEVGEIWWILFSF